MSENCKIETIIQNESKPLKIEIDFQEYQNLNMELETTRKNLQKKVEIIVALMGLIGTMGSEEMKSEMFVRLAEVEKEG